MSKEDIETMKTLQELENNLNELANKCIEMGKETATAIAIEQLKQPVVFMFMKSLKENEANKKRIEELLNSKVGVDLNFDNYISKSKIIKKLEEKEKEYKEANNSRQLNRKAFKNLLIAQITVYKELLKDGGE